MNDLKGRATREGEAIEVQVSGNLASSLHSARVADIYPGGSIIYVQDPGTAQVFIEETVKDGVGTPAVIPWEDKVSIPDPSHDRVTVFVKHVQIFTVAVELRGFTILADAVYFITKHVREDDYEGLFRICLDRSDKAFFTYCMELLKEIDEKTPFPTLYEGFSFPADADRFKLGGHDSELGHIHVDFAKKDDKWFLERIWLCK